MLRTIFFVANLVVVIVGGYFSYVFSAGLREHAKVIISHLESGDWEIQTDRPAIERRIRDYYRDLGEKWEIGFVGGGGSAYPMDQDHIKSTVTELGQLTVANSGALQFNANSLQNSYGALLAQLLETITPPVDDVRAKDALQDFALLIQERLRKPDRPADPFSLKRVNGILAKMPKFSILRQALINYEQYSISAGLDFPRFGVETSPSYDNAISWNLSAITLPQSGRCTGSVSPLGDTRDVADAEIALHPRILELSFVRPWISDSLLDAALSFTADPRISAHFSSDGDLRAIPWRMWLLLPENITFKAIKDADQPRLVQWVKDNICCSLACETKSFRINPVSVALVTPDRWKGDRSGLPPLLFAVVSRKRTVE